VPGSVPAVLGGFAGRAGSRRGRAYGRHRRRPSDR
jgi:hypothetical protein